MPRARWTGSIAFGLVNAPVRMYPAIDEHDLELHLMHTRDGSRIGYQKICKEEGEPVPDDEIAKGYEVDGELVLLDPEDFESAESEGYKTIEILFRPAGRDRPDLLRALVLSRAARRIGGGLRPARRGDGASRPRGRRALRLPRSRAAGCAARAGRGARRRAHALRRRDPPARRSAPRAQARRRSSRARDGPRVERFSGTFDPNAYEDRYKARLLEIVEEKRAGREVRAARSEEPERTPDLLAALQESLERHSRSGRSRNGKPRAKTGRGVDGADGLTVDGRARELGIAGRSRMNRRQLVAAIEIAERR